MTSRNVGRPSKLTPEVRNAILKAMGLGMPEARAAQLVGLDPSTLARWKERGNREAKGIYADFADALREALPRFELANLAIIVEARKKDWRAAAHLLKIRFPEHYGAKSAPERRFLEIVDWSKLSNEQLEAIAAGRNPFSEVPPVPDMTEEERRAALDKIRRVLDASDERELLALPRAGTEAAGNTLTAP